jgi:hypothetical protein
MTAQLIDKALKISSKRRRLLEEMRKAVRLGDRDAVFFLARKLTGLPHEKERGRINQSFN